MVEVDFEEVMKDFLQRAEAFLKAPDFSAGMELHDVAARAGVACNAHVEDPGRLVGIFHEFKRAIPRQDAARLRELLARIREIVPTGG